MILACHQPNFIPWVPYFSKMDQCDIFVILINVQFEKNGWQNRCQVNGKYWTKPIEKGNRVITEKKYASGQDFAKTNIDWIYAIARTLDIDTNKIVFDYATHLRGTERLADLCRHFGADRYLTNPEAAEKYLDTTFMESVGVKVIPHTTDLTLHVFEAFNRWGIEKTIRLMRREKEKCEILRSSSVTSMI